MGRLLVLMARLAPPAVPARHRHAARSACAGFESRDIKALSPEQVKKKRLLTAGQVAAYDQARGHAVSPWH